MSPLIAIQAHSTIRGLTSPARQGTQRAGIRLYKITGLDGSIERSGQTMVHEVHTIIVDDDVNLEFIRANCRAKKNYQHPTYPGYYYEHIRPKQIARAHWEVDCIATPFQLEPIFDDPLERPPVVTYDGSLVIEPTNVDSSGYPICTTAGELIAGVERDRPVRVYHVEKNYPADPDWLDDYLGAVNLSPCILRGRSRAAGTLKMVNQSAGPFVTEKTSRYFTLAFDLVFDPLGHKAERWNYGTLQLVQRKVNGKKRWFQEQIKTGSPPRPVTEAVPIGMNGAALTDFVASAEDGRPVDVSRLIRLKWDVQPVLEFNNVLPLR